MKCDLTVGALWPARGCVSRGLLGEIVATRQSSGFCKGPEHRKALKASRKPLKLRRLPWGPCMSAIADSDCDICRDRANPGLVDVQPAPLQPRFDDIKPTRICH